jgi:TolB-like protein/Tfp pilus assembly protein PilF
MENIVLIPDSPRGGRAFFAQLSIAMRREEVVYSGWIFRGESWRSRAKVRTVLFRFADCVFDPRCLELARAGQPVSMQPQVRALLHYLLERRDRAVSRDELHRAIWGSRVVTDATLNSRVNAARIAIGDDGKKQSMIRTLPRVGYRFVADVVEARSSSGRQVTAVSNEIDEIVAGADDLDRIDMSLPSKPSLVVLPFGNDAGDAADAVLADGLTHDVITQVARARWLFVVARGTAFKFRRGSYDPRDVGTALGVRYVVQGTFHRAGDRLWIRVELADAVARQELWAEEYERDVRSIVSLHAELADIIVGAIAAEIEHAERQRSLLLSPSTLDAWSAYHRGCWHMYQFKPEHYQLAEECFRRSLELDPAAPRAYAGLSFVHWQRAFLELSNAKASEIEKARTLAEESLAIDVRDPLGHWALGRAYLLDGRLDLAVSELDTAVTLNPSSAVGQYSLSYALMQTGNSALSNDIVSKARRLSPYDPMTFAMYAVRAQNLAFLDRPMEAAEYASRAASQPNSHYHVTAIAAFCNMLAGHTESARGYYSRLKSIRPDYSAETFLSAFKHRRDENVRLVRRTFGQLVNLG